LTSEFWRWRISWAKEWRQRNVFGFWVEGIFGDFETLRVSRQEEEKNWEGQLFVT
jgi:hypothetical protein